MKSILRWTVGMVAYYRYNSYHETGHLKMVEVANFTFIFTIVKKFREILKTSKLKKKHMGNVIT